MDWTVDLLGLWLGEDEFYLIEATDPEAPDTTTEIWTQVGEKRDNTVSTLKDANHRATVSHLTKDMKER